MKKLLSIILSLLMVFSALPLTMMASAATVTAAGYTFSWVRSGGSNDFTEVITPAGDELAIKDYAENNKNTCLMTSRNLVVGDKLVFTTKDSVKEGLYRVVFEMRAYSGRADLNIKINDRDYGKFVTPTSGGNGKKVTLFTDFVQAEDGPVTIEFVAASAGSMYIQNMHFEKVEYEYDVDGTNATLTGYIGTGGDIEIPTTLDGYNVVAVGANCFKDCETLTSVKMYKNVATIGENAFAGCVNLEKIIIDNGECEIFDSAETISDTALIVGGKNSTAQAYAEKYDREFEMIAFAKIGDEPYSSLADAFADAKDGDRIVLVKDVELEASITTDKAVVLDLAGFTITSKSATITTSAEFEIASTKEGKGLEYSGLEVIEPSTDADKIGTIADVSNKDLYVKGHYPSSGNAKVQTYENRVAVNKLIAVEYGKNYTFSLGSNGMGAKFVVREYKEDGSFVKSVGEVTSGTTYTPSSADAKCLGIAIYISNNSSYDILGAVQNGTFTPSLELAPVRGQIKFGSAFVKTSANFKMSNLKVTASSTGSFYEQTDAEAVPEFTAKDCTFAISSNSVVRPLKFSSNASKIDMQDCSVALGNNNNNAGFSIASASVGTFKNVKFAMANGMAVCVYNTGAEGITFDKCTITSSGDSGNCALVITNGVVNLVGGCSIGGKSAGYNTKISGGKITIDGATFNDTKNTSVGVLNITGGTLVVKSMAVTNSGTLTNNADKLKASLAEGAAFYTSSTPSPETILTKEANITSLKSLYVRACEHYCTGKQAGSKVCAYCSLETEISHDYSSIKYNETQHWGVCARCDEVQEAQDHEVGKNGKAATCTEPAVCGVCAQSFGEELGHSFTNYEQVSTDIAGCEHNPVTKAICDNGCGEEDYDYSALVNLKVTKEAVAPTCTEEGSTQEQCCTECDKVIEPSVVVPENGHTFGETVVEKDSNYANTGKGSHTCTVEGCGFSEDVVIPVKEFKGSTLAIIGDYDNPVQYQTIQDAVAEAKEGDVIILVKNGTVEGSVTLDKEIVIDLAGYTLKASSDSASFVTDKNLEIRSTVLGLGERYSGIIDVAPSTEEDEYGTIADVSNKDLYVAGHYNSSSGKLEANTNRIAVNKLIAVEEGRSYVMKTGASNSNLQFVIREFNKRGKFNNSVGAVTDGSTYTPSTDTAYIGVAFWISGDETSDMMAMLEADEFAPTITLAAVKGAISFAKPFVKTSAVVKMSNVKASATAATTFFESSATDVAAPAKLSAKDCQFTSSGTAQPLKFTSNATELDIQDSSIYSTAGNGLEISSAGVFGTIKNTKITKNSNLAFAISKTADAGIVFDGCSASQGSWDSTATQVSGGKVTFTGGTSLSGSNMASTVLNVSGGNVTLDGVTISGDKGTDTNRKLIAFSNSPTVVIKKATFTRGTANGAAGVITNNLTKLIESLAVGSTFFSSSTMNGNTVMSGDAITVKDKAVYVGECGHWERSVSKAETCTTAHTCNFCSMEFEPLGHDYSAYDSNETTHWRICSRCKIIDPEDNEPEAHFGGTATCEEPAECELCQEYHGEALGHLYPDANEDGSYDAEDYAFDEENHWLCCTREGCETAKEGTLKAHEGGKATCEDKAVCEDCGQEYGLALGHSYIRYESDNNASCTMDGTETAYCENGCGKSVSRIDDGSKLGHEWVTDLGYAPNCKEPGLTNGSHCDRCSIVREEQEVIPIKANAHNWDDGVLVQQGDCSTDTLYKYTCTYCEKEETSNLGKNPNKHTFSTEFTIDTPATCTTDGSMSKHCSKCEAKTSVTVIPKGHNNTIAKGAKEATYFAKGKTGTIYCQDCGEVVAKNKAVAKKVLKAPKVKVTGAKGKISVKYTKVKDAKGFQVRYKLANGKWKVVKFKTTKNATRYVKNLSKGKYTVQVRAYVTKGSKIAYGKWSKSQKVTVQ